MKKKVVHKSLVVGILLLFVGAYAVPSTTGNEGNNQKNNNDTFVTYQGLDLLHHITPPTSLTHQLMPHQNTIAQAGTTLITETHNGRVVEIDMNGTILWQKVGMYLPVDADRLSNGNTLIAEVGPNHVIEVDSSGAVVWSYSGMYGPFDADRLANGNTLIADTYGSRVIEVTPNGEVVWQKMNISLPSSVERLQNGNTLITDLSGGVIEVNSAGAIQWQYLGATAWDAKRLANGNTLIADIFGDRAFEVTSGGSIVWEVTGISASSVQRLPNGNTLIASGYDNRVIEVNASGVVQWEITAFYGCFDADRILSTPVFTVTITKGLGITATVENVGDVDATNVEVNITVTGGFVFFGRTKTVLVGDIAKNTAVTARSLPIGFGTIVVEAKVTCDEGIQGYGSTTGLLLLFFII